MTSTSGETPRIAFCTDTYPPQVNGVSVVTAISVRGAQERGWDVAVIAPRYPKPYGPMFAGDAAPLSDVALHLKLPSIPFPPYPDVRCSAPMFGRVLNALREFRPHLVHCETEFVVGRLGQRAATTLGVPLVSSYHTDFSRYTEAYGVPWLRPTVSGYLGRFHHRSLRVYTPSDVAKADLVELGIRDVEVWGRGVDVKQFDPRKRSADMRRELGIDDSFVFLMVARIAAEKRVEVVLDAYQVFRFKYPELRASLVVAGDGPELASLKRRRNEGVKFLGNLDRHGVLPTLYASGDAFVYAADTETLGLVILEAMASGLPVIAAPAGGVAENLRDGVNGLAFPVGNASAMADAMARMVRDNALCQRLGRGARAWAESRSWDVELDRLDVSYREVIAMRRVAAA